MTDSSNVDIDHLAALARLNLSSEEKEKFARELPKILSFVDQLQKVTLDEQVPTKQVVPLSQLRADEPTGTGLSLDQLQALAPDFASNQIVVPAVFAEEENA
jgi:aspartyl-tRNA(Asn)/glutamyl-tRNA(Gln) amidotransferase subunit C